MAYNEKLTNRVRAALIGLPEVEEKKMFRGITYMVDGKMCISVGDDRMMCRIDPSQHEKSIKEKGCSPVIMKGHQYKGYVYISEDSIQSKKDFEYWIKLALSFNKIAKATPKKKK